ncbi:helix-turn-helix transcriptional regulator [Bacillus gobiensis]|uniref:helix-turn-helix domain-containing protein n=1 Tax=Bacillus gobiensis TaxID=1441095 RepID=UPI003D21CCE0
MNGLGKPRTKFGEWLDKKGLTQTELGDSSGLGRTTISNLCSDEEYRPKFSTITKIKRGLDQLGVEHPPDDHFGM